jgi:hypothetical protein
MVQPIKCLPRRDVRGSLVPPTTNSGLLLPQSQREFRGREIDALISNPLP